MTSFWGVTLKWCIGISTLTQRWWWWGSREYARWKLKERKERKRKERRKGEAEGSYKCSGEIWETVQDFHYLWCKLSDPIIRPLISLSHFFFFFFSLSSCDQWSTVWGGEGCRTPSYGAYWGGEGPGMARRLSVPFRVNPSLIRAHSIIVSKTHDTHMTHFSICKWYLVQIKSQFA